MTTRHTSFNSVYDKKFSNEDLDPDFYQDDETEPIFEQIEDIDPDELLEELESFDEDDLY